MTQVAPAIPSAPTPFPSKLNRRRYTRVSTRQMRSCYLAHGIGPADGWVVDISLGGVFLRTSWPLPVGEQLAIELPRGGARPPVCVRGRVVSSSPSGGNSARSGMGVRFEPPDPLTLQQLRELIAGLAPAGTRLELSPEDNEVTRAAPIPNGVPTPKITAPPPPPPRASAPLPKLTAAMPTRIPSPQPSAPRSPVHEVADAVEKERLRNHAKGLLIQLSELQLQLASKDREIHTLREAVAHLQASNAQLRSLR